MNYRETYAEINLDYLDYNLAEIHNTCNKALFCVVKANAYGHGAIEIADFISKKSYVAYLCVSSIDEALDLRNHGIITPIINLGYTSPNHLNLCIENNITISVISLVWFREALQMNNNLSKLKCHLKIDSGMNRLGIKDINEFTSILEIGRVERITFEGIFTHYHSADSDSNLYCKNQLEIFKSFVSSTNNSFKWVHIANSDALIDIKEDISNAVRCGIAMYGYSTKSNSFKPVLSLYTHITQIKYVNKGEVISYAATYISDKRMRIAILPIGYADGLNRKFQNNMLYINNHPVKILGRICMDQTIIEFPDNLDVNRVEIIGEHQNCKYIANILETIPYEILTSLSDRITRRYYSNNVLIKESNLRYQLKQ